MKLDIRITTILVLISALVTFYFTNKQATKIETVEKEIIKNNVVTVVKEVVNKDGSKTIETIVTDKTQTNASKTETKIIAKVPQYLLSGTYNKINSIDIYGLQVQKRVLPSVLAGLTANTNKQIGLIISMEF